jgi:alpha-galactosidase
MLPFGRQAPGAHPCLYSHDEQRFIMTLWAIARSPLILGAVLPLDANDTWTLPLVTNAAVLAVNAASCGNAPTQVLNADASQLAAWSATAQGDGSVAVFALFNLREAPASIAVAVPALEPGQAAGALPRCVTDLWSGAAEGPLAADGTLVRAVNAHAGGMWSVGPC